jgi:hypothetical protein
MSVQIKVISPLGGSDAATITPEPSPTATTPRAKQLSPLESLTDNAPVSSSDMSTLSPKLVYPLDTHEG